MQKWHLSEIDMRLGSCLERLLEPFSDTSLQIRQILWMFRKTRYFGFPQGKCRLVSNLSNAAAIHKFLVVSTNNGKSRRGNFKDPWRNVPMNSIWRSKSFSLNLRTSLRWYGSHFRFFFRNHYVDVCDDSTLWVTRYDLHLRPHRHGLWQCR